jgi:hypothetical protein
MALVPYLSSVLSLACSPRPSRWVDKDTPQRHHCKVVDGEELQLVFSDEFQTAHAGPTGIDLDKWSPTEAIDTDTYGDTYLSPRLVSVANGSLNLSAADQGHASAGYTGAQVTSWNKFCYTGGYLEVRYKMPGRPREGLGIWPAIWTLGNLARDNFPSSVDNVWPFSYDRCKCPGPEAKYGQQQRISACADHPARYGLNKYQGRGAPEIDLLETTMCTRQMTEHLRRTLGAVWNDTCLISSLQLTPRLPSSWRPMVYTLPYAARRSGLRALRAQACAQLTKASGRSYRSEDHPWYSEWVAYQPNVTVQNTAFYGMHDFDTLGAITLLNDSAYTTFSTVGFSAKLAPECGSHFVNRRRVGERTAKQGAACRNGSLLTWWKDDVWLTRVRGGAFGAFGDTPERLVPLEPMYILLELKVSPQRWGVPRPDIWPLHFLVDYVRLYQADGALALGCDTPDFPSKRWIEGHHLDYGIPGTSLVFLPRIALAALVTLGFLLTFFGAVELSRVGAALHGALVACGPVWLALSSTSGASIVPQAGGALLWPVYLQTAVTAAALAQLMPTLPLFAAASAATALVVVQVQSLEEDAAAGAGQAARAGVGGTAPWAALGAVFVVLLVLGAAGGPRLRRTASVSAVALAGSQEAALGLGALLDCAWVSRLAASLGLPTADDAGTFTPSQNCRPGALLAASAVVGILGAMHQLLRLARGGAFAPPRAAATRRHRNAHHGVVESLREPLRPAAAADDTSDVAADALEAGRRTPTQPVGSLHSVHAGDEGDSPSFVRELRGGTPWHGERGEPETLPSPGNGRYSSLGRDLARSFEGGGTLGVAAARLFFGVANVPARAGRLASPEPSASRTEGNASARATVAEDDETAWGTVAAIAAAERLQAAVGLQSSVAAGQAAHVIALQQSARRTRRSAAAAACDVHGALTGAYIHWCRKLGLAPRTATSALHSEGGARVKGTPCATQIVEESVLYLCVWAEAANLRHMPELLCWLLHSLLGGRSAWTLGAVGGGSSLCASLLDDVIQPIYRVAAERMKAPSRLTYDDLNELFWSSRCELYSPFVGGSGGGDGLKLTWVGHALATCPKTHMESNSWLHLAQTFLKPLWLYFSLLYLVVTAAYSASSRSSLALALARASFSLYLFAMYSLAKELLDLWAHCALAVPRLDGLRLAASNDNARQWWSRKPPATPLLLGAARAVAKLLYASVVGLLGLLALSPLDCDSLPDGKPGSAAHDRRIYAGCAGVVPPSGLSPEGHAESLPLWAAFWTAGGVQLGTYALYSAFVGRVPALRLLTTPYRSERLGERFYARHHPRAHGGIAFWLALLLVWSAACYFLAARPAAEGYAGFARLYEQRVASPSEFALLVVSLAVPLLPFALILSDFLFTVLLAAVAWLSAQQLGLGRLTRFRQLVRGFDAVGRRYAAALIADAQRPPAACFGSPSPRAGASDGESPMPTPSPAHTSLDRGLDEAATPARDDADAEADARDVNDGGDDDGVGAGTQARWLFATGWDALVHELRQSDLLSNAEASALQFLRLPRSAHHLATPGWAASPAAASSSPHIQFSAFQLYEPPMILSCGAALMAANRFGSVREAVAVSELAIRWLDSDDDGGGAEGAARAARAAANLLRAVAARLVGAGGAQRALETLCVALRALSAADVLRRAGMPRALRAAHALADAASEGTLAPAARAALELLDALGTILPDSPAGAPAALPPSASTAKAASASAAAALWRLRASAFLTDEAFARRQLLALRSDAAGQRWAGALATLLAATATGRLIKPTSSEARRRLKSFAGSLALPMPAPPPVACMRSVSFLTPVYAETVIFSLGELCAAGPDGRQLLDVLQELYADEWANFCERRGVPSSLGAADLLVAAPGVLQSVRLWASFRGQTLARTVRGIMQYDAALRLQASLEQPNLDGADVAELVCSKFDYVVCCQLLGAQRRRADPAADDVDWLLRAYPGLKVVYLEQLPADAEAEEKHDAVLLRSGHNGEVAEAARVRLPGPAILGEGKPENQNVGLPFTRGEICCLVDMNQDGVSRATARQPPLCEAASECMPTARLSTSRRP